MFIDKTDLEKIRLCWTWIYNLPVIKVGYKLLNWFFFLKPHTGELQNHKCLVSDIFLMCFTLKYNNYSIAKR